MQRVRTSMATKFQQLEATVQEKLEQAQTRREQIEQEQKEKLRTHVSFAHILFASLGLLYVMLARFFYISFRTLNLWKSSKPSNPFRKHVRH